MLSFKEKIELVRNLDNAKIDLANIDKYLEYLKYKSLVSLLFKKIIESLIDLDVDIISIYDSISEEDWSDIVTEYETPIEKPLYGVIRDKIRTFIAAYKKIDDILLNINVNILLECLGTIPLNKTGSVQFLFFRLGCAKACPVLCFLFENLKNNPIVYIPYFTSFVTRCKVDSHNAILAYIKYCEELKANNGLKYILASQGLMYICCFKPDYIKLCKNVCDQVFSNNIYMYMNPMVVETFCSFSSYKFKCFKSFDNFSLYYFPFDKSIFEKIHDLYADKYIEFQK
ncbi:hypothetical protein P3W45_000037 [Vairimorpha bombi]|jgi:hypothetical protein